MDKHISFLLSAGETLKRTIDPEGILASGTIVNIGHRISDDEKEFVWNAEVEFPNDDILKVRGHFNDKFGNTIQRCIYRTRDEKLVLSITPSKTLLKSFGDLMQLPAQMKANLARISQETANSGQSDVSYDMYVLEIARKALLWEVDGNELTETKRFRFNEISMNLKKDPAGFYSKNTIIGSCSLDGAIIKARTIVDMYGLSSQALTLDRTLGGTDEISAYCYTEDFTGRKVPSLRVAFKLYYMLAGVSDLQQRRVKNSIEMPSKKKVVRKENQTSQQTAVVSTKPKINDRYHQDLEDRYQYPKRIQRKH